MITLTPIGLRGIWPKPRIPISTTATSASSGSARPNRIGATELVAGYWG